MSVWHQVIVPRLPLLLPCYPRSRTPVQLGLLPFRIRRHACARNRGALVMPATSSAHVTKTARLHPDFPTPRLPTTCTTQIQRTLAVLAQAHGALCSQAALLAEVFPPGLSMEQLGAKAALRAATAGAPEVLRYLRHHVLRWGGWAGKGKGKGWPKAFRVRKVRQAE